MPTDSYKLNAHELNGAIRAQELRITNMMKHRHHPYLHQSIRLFREMVRAEAGLLRRMRMALHVAKTQNRAVFIR